jgi:DNA-directed RNA polymerase subunit RPC12/RpoP
MLFLFPVFFYSCLLCGKIHYNMSCLIQHYAREHPEVRDVFPCIECGYYALNISALRAHSMTHKVQEVSSDDEEPEQAAKPAQKRRSGSNVEGEETTLKRPRKIFECPTCSKQILTKQGFDYHMLVHSNEKPYVCDICKRAFRSKQAAQTCVKCTK